MDISRFKLTGLWQPEGPSPKVGLLLVVLHGRGDSAHGFEGFKRELAVPGLSALLFNAPDEYYTGYSWYDLPPDQLPGIERSRVMLSEAFDEIFHQGYLPERTVLCGFSQGCLMTLEFGARYPRKLAGYLGISGYCYDPERLIAEATPAVVGANWLITHGTGDDVLPVGRTRAQMQELKAAGFNLDYREYPKGHTIDTREELPYLRGWIKNL